MQSTIRQFEYKCTSLHALWMRGVSRLVVLLFALHFIFCYVATWLSITWINSWAAVYSPDKILSFHVEATPASGVIYFQ